MNASLQEPVETSTQAAAATAEGHLNWMAGTSYTPDNPLVVLRMAAASCFFGEPRYYAEGTPDEVGAVVRREPRQHRVPDAVRERLVVPAWLYAGQPGQALERAIDAALDFDPESTLKVAVALRQEDHIRVTPQVILVRAAYHPKVSGTGLIRRFAPRILQRADEPAVQLAYLRVAFADKPVPNALRKAWATFYRAQSEYALAKYQLKNQPIKTVDVVNLCRPQPTEALNKLMRGELRLQQRTWESLISEEGSTEQGWRKARDEFFLRPQGHMALLRNLRNLDAHGLLDAPTLEALKAGVKDGQQLPFRYYSAYRALQNDRQHPVSAQVLRALEECLMLSQGNAPRFAGRVMSLCDNSGSAHGACTSEFGTMRVSTIANLTGVLTGMLSDSGHVGLFGDELTRLSIDASKGVFEQLDQAEQLASKLGQGTENGVWLFFDEAIRNREVWDHVFIYSDMQAGHGGLYGVDPGQYQDYAWPTDPQHIDVLRLVQEYHARVNPRTMFYLVQVAGYTDTLLPEHYERAVVLGGWGAGLLHFAHALGQTWEALPTPAAAQA